MIASSPPIALAIDDKDLRQIARQPLNNIPQRESGSDGEADVNFNPKVQDEQTALREQRS